MDSRQQFEEWYCESDHGPQVDPMWMVYNEERNTYGLDLINRDWVAWQASRESLVVELPEDAPLLFELREVVFRDEIIEAIHSVGIRTK